MTEMTGQGANGESKASPEKMYACALHSVPGIGNKTLLFLYSEFGSCKAAYEASEKELKQVLTSKLADRLLNLRDKTDPKAEYEELYRRGIDYYPIFDEKYPEKLRDIPDAPFGLYCMGELPDPTRPAAAIVGARASSEYGKYAARLFGQELALGGVQIISGMARGIDGISQAAAINAGGTSYGVLGSGVDVCYPKENKGLYDALISSGGIISEYVPGTEPKPGFFPPRNRIISGLSDVLLVIEARMKSGTLITVDMALEQGREVFALPGRVCDKLSEGCNSLIRQGAGIASSPEDITEYLRKNYGLQGRVAPKNTDRNFGVHLDGLMKAVYEKLDFYPKTIQTICDEIAKTGINTGASEVMNALVELCFLKKCAQNGGGFYRK